MLIYLDRVAREHARLYSERYGLKAVSPIRGDVRLSPISDRPGFFTIGQTPVEIHQNPGLDEKDLPGDGYFEPPALVVIHAGRKSRRELAATLVHELTHLLSWHLLGGWQQGPQGKLAPWLDEGLADDLAFSMADREGNLSAEPLGPANLRYSRRLGQLLAEIERRIETGTAPSLEQLADMDQETFLSGDRDINYTLAALWVRYLLSHKDLAIRFQAFLASLSEGTPADSRNLGAQLDRGWPQLDRGFRAWLRKQRLRF